MRAPAKMAVRIGALASKEALHILRDPRTLYLALVMPVVLLIVFGYGVTFDIDSLPLAVADADDTVASRALVRAFVEPHEFALVAEVEAGEAEGMLRSGEAVAVLIIPRDFERSLAHEDTPVQLLVNGADAVVANQVLSKADAIVRAQSLRRLAENGGAGAIGRPPVQVKIWTRFNPAGKSAIFMVPGLAAYLLAIAAVLLTALTISGEWERGSMEQLFASPVGRLEIVLGKLLPYLVLGMLQLLLIIAVGVTAFDVPLRGSVALLFVMGAFFLVGMLGQGLLISILAKNQLVATQAGALSALLPSMLLSGMLFPIDNMPRVLQWLSQIVPARYLVHGLRGIMLKGNGFGELWPDLLAQIIFAAAIIAISTARFKRRVA